MAVAGTLWDRAQRGERFQAGSRLITDQDVRDVVAVGGFVHPLFTDPDHARSLGFDAAPMPGQALLVLMGGLVEAHGAFDDSVLALLGYRDVEFLRRVSAGDELRLEVELVGVEPRDEPDRGVVVARFNGSVEGQLVCTALVLHLVRTDVG